MWRCDHWIVPPVPSEALRRCDHCSSRRGDLLGHHGQAGTPEPGLGTLGTAGLAITWDVTGWADRITKRRRYRLHIYSCVKPRGGKILTISPLFLLCNSDPSPFQSIWWDGAVSSALEFHLGLSSTRPLPFRWKSWRARFEGSFQAAHGDMCKLHP